ncbi:MAG TPA: 4a-hydroxytetrahydrobiopterin dehydratase [Thermoanaerobaculia bacterium]|nr:4a-hydroxytetrahydrobiopterin dehydratase [Thermoanaerobaculia bacterium]
MDVVLYTRQNCPLCEKAKATLLEAGIKPREVDVDTDLDLLRRFDEHVPVIFIDGSEAFRHRIEWRVVERHHLEREFRFKNFADALAFTNRIGEIAEQLNHHPDIALGWGKVRVTTWTHDAGGITPLDFKLAGAIEAISSSAAAQSAR